MKCDYCSKEFEINEAKCGCKGCPMSSGCGKIKCPNCNYEMLQVIEFKIFRLIREMGKKIWENIVTRK